MPKLFVITHQADAAAISQSLLGGRVGAAKREAVIAALRRANPAIDLDAVQPGTIIVIPDLPDINAVSEDPVAGAVDDLLTRTNGAVQQLRGAADAAEQQRRVDADEARAILGSAEVEQQSGNLPELKANVESVRAELDKDDAEAEAGREEFERASESWLRDLEVLRKLTG
jgi:hypothetical protein